jgi:preprotein translocase subunit SecE
MKNPLAPLINYFRSSKVELEKVTWPTRQQTIRYSALVVGVSLAMAAFFAALDFGLGQSVDLALKGRSATTAPANQPVVPDLQPIESNGAPVIEGVDAEGNSVPINVTPLPLDGSEPGIGGFTVTP